MTSTPDRALREERFGVLYAAAYSDLLRFVQRRVHASHAEDVVGDVMLVAWRRLDDVPLEQSDARAWLFGVAHRTILGARRREGRQQAVAVRLADASTQTSHQDSSAERVADRIALAAAWPRLSEIHQEALALIVTDGLSAAQAGAVLGISATAFRLRLSRARKRLRTLMASSGTAETRSADLAELRSTR